MIIRLLVTIGLIVLTNVPFTNAAIAESVESTCYVNKIPPAAHAKQSKEVSLRGELISAMATRDPERALRDYENLLPAFRKAGDLEGIAVTLNNIGVLLRRLGRYSESIAKHQDALKIRRTYKDCAALAQSFNNLGVTFGVLDREKEALAALRDALAVRRRLQDQSHQANTLTNIALAHRRLGQFEEAFKAVYEARDLRYQDAEGALQNTLGLLFDDVARYSQALAAFQQAESFHTSRGNPAGARTAALNAGQTLYGIGQTEDALNAFSRVFLYSVRPKEKATALMNIALAKANLGDIDGALDNGALALQLAGNLPEALDMAALWGEYGLLLRSKGDLSGAADYFERSLAATRQAPGAGVSANARVSEATGWQALGTVLEAKGEVEEALEDYRKAIHIREGMRSSVGVDDFRSGFADRIATLYERMILLLMKLGRYEEAFAYSERSRARTFLETMLQRRLELPRDPDSGLAQRHQDLLAELTSLEQEVETASRGNPERNSPIVTALLARLDQKRAEYETLLTRLKLQGGTQTALLDLEPLSLKEIQRGLGAETTLVSYVTTADAVVTFVIKRSSFDAIMLPVSHEKIVESVEWFRSFAQVDSPARSDRSLMDLYSWLIGPIEPLLTDTLGIIPNGPLHYLPFSALSDGKSYLGERKSLFYLPSVDFIRFMTPSIATAPGGALVMAHSQAGLPKLSYAKDEADRVAQIYGVFPLTGQAASETALRRGAPESVVLHIAAHGQLNARRPLFSRVLLAGDAVNDGVVNVYEIYGLNLRQVNLVVLSACETQLGRQSSGDEIIGLNRAFLLAQAKTVVASLWTANDEASSLFMETFHSELAAGKTKAQALRDAQDIVRAQYPHPYYWAAFVLSGDPGQGLDLPIPSAATDGQVAPH